MSNNMIQQEALTCRCWCTGPKVQQWHTCLGGLYFLSGLERRRFCLLDIRCILGFSSPGTTGHQLHVTSPMCQYWRANILAQSGLSVAFLVSKLSLWWQWAPVTGWGFVLAGVGSSYKRCCWLYWCVSPGCFLKPPFRKDMSAQCCLNIMLFLHGHGMQGCLCAPAAASSCCIVCLALRKLSAINFCTIHLLEGSDDWVIHLSKIF